VCVNSGHNDSICNKNSLSDGVRLKFAFVKEFWKKWGMPYTLVGISAEQTVENPDTIVSKTDFQNLEYHRIDNFVFSPFNPLDVPFL